MANQCGIWIDHREAVLILLEGDDQPTVKRVTSDIEGKTRRRRGSPGVTAKGWRRSGAGQGRSGGIQDVAAEQRSDRKYRQELKRYYRRVIDATGGRTAVLVFGPGQAKDELAKAIDEAGGGRHTVWTEAAEAPTEPQMVAFVRAFFDTAKA